tara:strand:+ start:6394 stop:6648 length:255 start_codon:yes stop_codon:yes gene_type:complete
MGFIKVNGVGPIGMDEVAFVKDSGTDKVNLHYNNLTTAVQLSFTDDTQAAALAAVRAAVEKYQGNQEGPIITVEGVTASNVSLV